MDDELKKIDKLICELENNNCNDDVSTCIETILHELYTSINGEFYYYLLSEKYKKCVKSGNEQFILNMIRKIYPNAVFKNATYYKGET